jgi:hypothetical protein
MTAIIIQLSEATDCRTVDRIVEENIDRLPNPFNIGFLCKFANNAKRRILRIQREKRKSFINQLN